MSMHKGVAVLPGVAVQQRVPHRRGWASQVPRCANLSDDGLTHG